MSLTAPFEDDLHELKGKLDFLERRNSVAGLLYFMLSYECDLLNRQISVLECAVERCYSHSRMRSETLTL